MINQKDLIAALQKSMVCVFDYFIAELEKKDGQVLDIRLTANGEDVKLEYGVSPIEKL